MNDEFIMTAWRKPPAAFARQLRERLHHLDRHSARSPRSGTVFRRLAYAASLLVAVGLFSLPSVRADVRAFLDLFRVVNFAAVSVPMDRVKSLLTQQGLDLPRMVGEQVQMVKAPGAPQTVATPGEAGALAGISLRMPAWVPVGLEPQQIQVMGDLSWRVTASTDKLQRVVDSLGIDDLSVPQGIDGQTVTIYVPPVVRITYAAPGAHAMLVQARRPEASLPAGLDLSQLAEIGLRVLGIDRTQAHDLAQNIDWHTTLVVPVPADVAVFRQVNIQGSTGLLIESARNVPGKPSLSQLLWASGDQVFALSGDLRPDELFEMAQSLH
jgi:hypothetical protein